MRFRHLKKFNRLGDRLIRIVREGLNHFAKSNEPTQLGVLVDLSGFFPALVES